VGQASAEGHELASADGFSILPPCQYAAGGVSGCCRSSRPPYTRPCPWAIVSWLTLRCH